ncbi:MAG: beta-ketoacyl-[acyl-carrier-protein] synthase family protein [Chloroflexi bacterium]|nr:beta-ketoacyl-[acyl-carrier-protein] synthase family protein [Chloroflexota bacterium]
MLAITGADLITSVGASRTANFHAFCQGVSGNRRLQGFNRSHFRYQRAYEIPDRVPEGVDRKGRGTQWLCWCVRQALREAGIAPESERVALLVGTGLQELRSVELWWADGFPLHVSEIHFATALQQEFGLGGAVLTFSNACSASTFALGLGADLIALGEADAVIVGGCDSMTESMLGAVDRVTAVAPEQLQPFDQDRRGVLMGEGAAAVILEPLEQAIARGKSPLALLRGVGMSCDAYHETAPSPDGMATSIVDAHRRAAIAPEEVDLIMAHGTGTMLNDQAEALALKKVFGAGIGHPLVSGLKSMTGHTSGASGLIGVIVAIEAMRQSCVPPTIYFSKPMAGAEELNIVVGAAKPASIRIAQVNAFGFGGVNAVAVLERVVAA